MTKVQHDLAYVTWRHMTWLDMIWHDLAWRDTTRHAIRHVVLGYGFRGHSPGGVAASGISTTEILFPVGIAAPGGLKLGSVPLARPVNMEGATTHSWLRAAVSEYEWVIWWLFLPSAWPRLNRHVTSPVPIGRFRTADLLRVTWRALQFRRRLLCRIKKHHIRRVVTVLFRSSKTSRPWRRALLPIIRKSAVVRQVSGFSHSQFWRCTFCTFVHYSALIYTVGRKKVQDCIFRITFAKIDRFQ